MNNIIDLYCQLEFNFELPTVTLVQCSEKFLVGYRTCDNIFYELLFIVYY